MMLHEIAGQYKTDIDTEDEVIRLLKQHCSDALKTIDEPIVRGMTRMKNGFGIIHGEAGKRESANTTNHYTVILDQALPKEYPRRSASIICANWVSQGYAHGYGQPHAIFPYDGVKIGVCPERDMFYSEVKLGRRVQAIHRWNEFFDDRDISDKSFNALVRDFKAWLDTHDYMGIEDHKDHLAEYLKQEYAVPFKLATTATAEIYNDGDQEHEVWIGGKCIAIDYDLFESVVKKIKGE